MKKGNSFLAKLISCVKERRLPWRIEKFLRRFSLKRDLLNIEISNCNLKCAMCPRGGVDGLINNRKGMMDFELFKKINLCNFLFKFN